MTGATIWLVADFWTAGPMKNHKSFSIMHLLYCKFAVNWKGEIA